MGYGGRTCSAEIVWLLFFSSFEAPAKHMENTGKVTFHILSQKDKMSWCELSILHLALYTVGTQETAAAIVSLLFGGGVLLLSPIWLFVSSWTAACQALQSPTISGVGSNSCPLSWWCYLIISSSAALFSFCLQAFPSSGSFPVIWLFALSGHSIRASASASSPSNEIQGWFPLGLTGLISLQSKGLSRVFSSTTILDGRYHKGT